MPLLAAEQAVLPDQALPLAVVEVRALAPPAADEAAAPRQALLWRLNLHVATKLFPASSEILLALSSGRGPALEDLPEASGLQPALLAAFLEFPHKAEAAERLLLKTAWEEAPEDEAQLQVEQAWEQALAPATESP